MVETGEEADSTEKEIEVRTKAREIQAGWKGRGEAKS